MRKLGVTVLLAAVVGGPAQAGTADEFEQGMGTMWEVLWHQSGTPTRLVRWEQAIRVRATGIDLAIHKENLLRALRTVAEEAGVKLVDVSDNPDGAQQANLSVEIVANDALEDNQPCVTYLTFNTETKIDSATMQMRSKDAFRCAYHEAMHAMGLRGHPAGKTVLSYFPWKVDGLLPLDRVMLRAWYSPHMRSGVTPFEALPVLADELIHTLSEKDKAIAARDKYFARIIEQMRLFADGGGDVPAVVKRSGKWTVDGVTHGRTEMSYFLGVAYLEGATVDQDRTQAQNWLRRAASAGNGPALARLGAFR